MSLSSAGQRLLYMFTLLIYKITAQYGNSDVWVGIEVVVYNYELKNIVFITTLSF